MTPRLPPPPQPDAHALARGQARLLADLSRIQPESAADSQAMATEADVPHAPTPTEPLEATHAPWHGSQAAWEAASRTKGVVGSKGTTMPTTPVASATAPATAQPTRRHSGRRATPGAAGGWLGCMRPC